MPESLELHTLNARPKKREERRSKGGEEETCGDEYVFAIECPTVDPAVMLVVERLDQTYALCRLYPNKWDAPNSAR